MVLLLFGLVLPLLPLLPALRRLPTLCVEARWVDDDALVVDVLVGDVFICFGISKKMYDVRMCSLVVEPSPKRMIANSLVTCEKKDDLRSRAKIGLMSSYTLHSHTGMQSFCACPLPPSCPAVPDDQCPRERHFGGRKKMYP